jgi:hypothetical protein
MLIMQTLAAVLETVKSPYCCTILADALVIAAALVVILICCPH